MNRYLTSKLMVIREMQIKTIRKYTTEPLNWGKMNKSDHSKCGGEDWEHNDSFVGSKLPHCC